MSDRPSDRIASLWAEFRRAIDHAYDAAPDQHTAKGGGALRDFTTTHASADKLEELVDRERRHEQRHRAMFADRDRGGYPITARQAAQLLIMRNAIHAARLVDQADGISPGSLLTVRDTARDALLLGWIVEASAGFSSSFADLVGALDYSAVNGTPARKRA